MRLYDWAGLTLASELDLPELYPAVAEQAAGEIWTASVIEGRPPLLAPRRWFHRWRLPDGQRWLSFAGYPGGYLLRFHGLADFEVRHDRREILGYPRADTPANTFTHLLLDQVLPLTIDTRRRLALHASVVNAGGRAAAFMGATGQGKSTLAAAFARRGYGVLSDDCCVIERSEAGFDVVPTYPGLRLFPETIAALFERPLSAPLRVAHYSRKQRVAPASPETVRAPRVPLRGLYTFAPREDAAAAIGPGIRRRSSREGVLDVIGSTFYLDVREQRRVRDGFELAAEVVSSCPVRLLTLPWNLSALDSAVDAIIDDLTR